MKNVHVYYTIAGGDRDRSHARPADIKTGLGGTYGGNLCFNDAELNFPKYGEKPATPTAGYNRHGHSSFAGGALDINTLELIEYDFELDDDKEWISGSHSKHSQQYWVDEPTIKKERYTSRIDGSTTGEYVEHIGFLDVEFDQRTRKFKASAYEIDVDRTVLVKRNANGEIATDDNGEPMSAPLYQEDETKTNTVWDKDAKVWRFYAVYADDPDLVAE
jgi:hypothetical protein